MSPIRFDSLSKEKRLMRYGHAWLLRIKIQAWARWRLYWVHMGPQLDINEQSVSVIKNPDGSPLLCNILAAALHIYIYIQLLCERLCEKLTFMAISPRQTWRKGRTANVAGSDFCSAKAFPKMRWDIWMESPGSSLFYGALVTLHTG